MLQLKDFRQTAKGLADLLPYAALVRNGVVLNKDGSFTAAWLCRGIDTDSAEPVDLALQASRFNHAIKILGSGWVIHMDAFRSPHDAYSPREYSHFPDPVTQMIDDERRAFFSSGICYTTDTALSLTYKPDYNAAKLAGKAQTGVDTQSALEAEITKFHNSIVEFEEVVSTVLSMERLGEYTAEDVAGEQYSQSDLLSHLQQCITGELHPIRVPDVPMYLDNLLGGRDLFGGTEPRLGRQHIAVISIDGLPSDSQPCMLHILNKLPITFRWSTRAILLDQYDATKEIETYWKTWNQQVFKFMDKFFNNANARANRDALDMRNDAEQAKMEVQNGAVGACYMTSTIVLMDENRELLMKHARELRKTIRTLGFGCRIETINALEAWLGSLPGNGYANLRRPMVNTLNLAHMMPLSTIWTGQPANPCPFYPPNSPPLSVVLTDGATPFWLNLHVGDLGHTLIFGPTGSGKSTLLSHIAAAFRRYGSESLDGTRQKGAQIFAFDKGLSMFPLTLATGGVHYDIGNSEGLAFCPLQEIDTPEDQAWAEEWIEDLMILQGISVLPAHRTAIHEGMTLLANNPPEMRGLTEFHEYVPSMEVREAIQHYTLGGGMGHLLDSNTDSLGLSDFTVFEIETLMNMGDKNLIPVLTYIFRRIEKALDGRPSFLILDEAWIVLGHPVFKEKIREWLKVLRKKNCAVILATQSLSDAKKSGIIDVLAESCPSKIFLANKDARQEEQTLIYKDIGCNSRIIDVIAGATPKRDYYVMQPAGGRLIQLALGKKELAFIGVSDPDNIAKIKELHAIHGPDGWQHEWLKLRKAA